MAIYNNISFLLSASLISCVPGHKPIDDKLFIVLVMKALKLCMFAFDESHDLVIIPIFLPLTT